MSRPKRRPLPPAPKAGDYVDVLSVNCDACAAGIGEPCHRPSGALGLSGMQHIPHSSRIAKWERDGKPTMKTRPQGQQQSWHETEEDWR